MDSKNLNSSLQSILTGLQNYVDLQIRYNKLLLAKRMGEIASVFTLIIILAIIFSFAVLFLSFFFVDWYAEYYGSRYIGNIIIFGFYALIGIIIMIFREQLIISPIRRMFANNFSRKDGEEGVTFRSSEAINLQLKNYREIIEEEEVELKETFENLGHTFTLGNVIQTASRSIYKSFVTTSNIARLTYNIVSKIKEKVSKKKTRKSKKKPPLLDEEYDD